MADRSVIVSEGSDIDANFGEKDVDLGGFPRGNNGHNDLRRFFVNSENDLSDIDEDFDGFDVGWVRDNFRQPSIPRFCRASWIFSGLPSEFEPFQGYPSLPKGFWISFLNCQRKNERKSLESLSYTHYTATHISHKVPV